MTDTFPTLLRRYRERAGLGCNALSAAAGLTPSYVSRLEHGQRNPPRRSVVLALADALGLTGLERVQFITAAGYWPDEGPLTPQLVDVLVRFYANLAEGVAIVEQLRQFCPDGAVVEYRRFMAPAYPTTVAEWEATVRRVAGD